MELSITLVKREATLISFGWQKGDWDMSVCKHISSVIGGHIAQLGDFSSLARSAWQTGSIAPFFPYRRQYHSSDLSPFACLNVWKQDVLRLLALLGKAGMLIPHPRGAWQYGAAWWPPASSGSRCHNTSHIPSNQPPPPSLLPHLHHWVSMNDRSTNRKSQGSSGCNKNKNFLDLKWNMFSITNALLVYRVEIKILDCRPKHAKVTPYG